MEIKDFTKGKITMVIGNKEVDSSELEVIDISSLLNNYMLKPKIIGISNIDNINLYHMTVGELINNFLLKYSKKGNKFINQILKLSTLSVDYLNVDPLLLSSSEKYKLLLALALSLNPKLVVIKDISCYLDRKSMNEVMFTLKKLKREFNKTFIIIDNDVDYFYSVADNVMVIEEQECLLNDKKEVLYDNYTMLKKKKFPIPICIEFIYYVKKNHDTDLLIRDDVKDIMKDIYRSL